MSSNSHHESKIELDYLGLGDNKNTHWNQSPPELYEEIIQNGEGILSDNYAIRIKTGEYTGRSPKDKFLVDQSSIHDDIDWGEINQPIEEEVFDNLFDQVSDYLSDKKLYVRDCFAGADKKYQLSVRLVSEAAYHSLFAYNMFRRPTETELENHDPDFTIMAAPNFEADPEKDGTDTETFILVNFDKKIVLIGGTLYSGEVKKGIFGIMNYLLPKQGVMGMHCSSNMDEDGSTAIFFGMSGTGKTTLSSNPNRILIGDDEHGWSENGVFNIEGGCYAKTIDLSAEGEPLIYDATRKPGTILENVVLNDDRSPDYEDTSLTKNTRCSYPINYIPNATETGMGNHPDNVVFLTCDAFGVLPPISKLTPEQAMYHFISGYTAKIPGTVRGITEPEATFSACFGAPFMPMHPTVYAELLAEKTKEHNSNIWLFNTGWTGGPYGEGHRMELKYTRQMVSEALAGNLNDVEYKNDEIFGLAMPVKVNGIPNEVLDPRNTWEDKQAYDKKARQLARMFKENFQQFKGKASDELIEAGPVV